MATAPDFISDAQIAQAPKSPPDFIPDSAIGATSHAPDFIPDSSPAPTASAMDPQHFLQHKQALFGRPLRDDEIIAGIRAVQAHNNGTVANQSHEQPPEQYQSQVAEQNSAGQNFSAGFGRSLATPGRNLIGTVAPSTATDISPQSLPMSETSIAGKAGELAGGFLSPQNVLLGMGPGAAAIGGAVEGFGKGRIGAEEARRAGQTVSTGTELLGAAGTAAVDAGAQAIASKGFGTPFPGGIAGRIAGNVGIGGVVASGQTLGENAVARATFDPNRQVMDGVAGAGIEGGLTQGVIAGAHEAIGHVLSPRQPAPQPQTQAPAPAPAPAPPAPAPHEQAAEALRNLQQNAQPPRQNPQSLADAMNAVDANEVARRFQERADRTPTPTPKEIEHIEGDRIDREEESRMAESVASRFQDRAAKAPDFMSDEEIAASQKKGVAPIEFANKAPILGGGAVVRETTKGNFVAVDHNGEPLSNPMPTLREAIDATRAPTEIAHVEANAGGVRQGGDVASLADRAGATEARSAEAGNTSQSPELRDRGVVENGGENSRARAEDDSGSGIIPDVTPEQGAGRTTPSENAPQRPTATDKFGSPLQDLRGGDIPTNDDGTITLYHRTTPEAKASIERTGTFRSKEYTGDVYFSTSPTGNADGYGDAVVVVRVPPNRVALDDAFENGEVHVRVSKADLNYAKPFNQPTPAKSGGTSSKLPSEQPAVNPSENANQGDDNQPGDQGVLDNVVTAGHGGKDTPKEPLWKSGRPSERSAKEQADYVARKQALADDKENSTQFGTRRKELENKLRDQVIEEIGAGKGDKALRYPADRPGEHISPELARSEAAKLPEDHPARVTLHNLLELEKNPPRTKVTPFKPAEMEDGARVQVNPKEQWTVNHSTGEIEDGIRGPIPETIYGTKVLPPAEGDTEFTPGRNPTRPTGHAINPLKETADALDPVVKNIKEKVKQAKDWLSIEAVPKLSRAGVGDLAASHALARDAVPFMVKHKLAQVFDEGDYKNPDVMEKTTRAIRDDNILGIHDNLKSKAEAAEARAEEAKQKYKGLAKQRKDLPDDATGKEKRAITIEQGKALTELAAASREAKAMRKKALDIQNAHDLAKLNHSVKEAAEDPAVMRHVENWKKHVDAEATQHYNELKGLDTDTEQPTRGRHLGARMNLLALDKEGNPLNPWLQKDEGTKTIINQGGSLNAPKVKRDPFARHAKGTGQYSDDAHMILENAIGSRWNEVTKLRLYKGLEEKGVGVRLTEDGQKPPQGWRKVENATMPRTTKAGGTEMADARLYVRPDVFREVRDTLKTDLNAPQHPFAKVLNAIQLASTTDVVAHGFNLERVVANTLGEKSAAKDLIKKIPIVGSGMAIHEIAKTIHEVSTDSPEVRADLDEMARKGYIRPEFPASGIQKIARTQEAIHKMDSAVRLILLRHWRNLVERGAASPGKKAEREFMNGVGQYNARLMGPLQRMAKQSGLSPFIVAGRNFNRQATRYITGNPGFEAPTAAQGLQNRAIQLALPLAALSIPAVLNKITTGNVFGRPGTRIGQWDTGSANDKEGKHSVIDFAQFTGVARGLDQFGLRTMVDGIRSGRTANNTAGDMLSNSLQGRLHPFLGPATSFAFKAATGRQLDLRGQMEAKDVPGKLNQFGENIRAATESQNPMLYGAVKDIKKTIIDRDPTISDFAKGIGQVPKTSAGFKEVKPVDPRFEAKHDQKASQMEIRGNLSDNAQSLLKEKGRLDFLGKANLTEDERVRTAQLRTIHSLYQRMQKMEKAGRQDLADQYRAAIEKESDRLSK